MADITKVNQRGKLYLLLFHLYKTSLIYLKEGQEKYIQQ